MYKIEQHAAIHNRFDVIVQDARTGQVKQTAVAYNIILNKWFNSVSYTGGLYAEYTHLTQIGLGTGTGTLAVTRSDLFTALVYKTATVVETVYASPTSYVTKEIRLEAEEYVGSTITEVGFRDTYATYKQLVTHAFLKDSEGNQIAIAKTADDVVIVRGTFYVTFTNGGFGTNGIYAPPSENKVISCLFGFNSMPMEARFSRYVSDTPAHMGEYLHGQKTTSMSACTRDTTLWKIDYPVFTWGYGVQRTDDPSDRHAGLCGDQPARQLDVLADCGVAPAGRHRGWKRHGIRYRLAAVRTGQRDHLR